MARLELNFNIKSKLEQVIPAAKAAVARTLFQFGEEVMTESKRRVPLDTGALMNTGQVTLPEESNDEISVTLGYGSESVDYALYVHENMSPSVKWSRPGSGPKFLENPIKEKQGELQGRIKSATEAAMKDL